MIWKFVTTIVYAFLVVFSTYILSSSQLCKNDNSWNINISDYVLGIYIIYIVQLLFLIFSILYKSNDYQLIENNTRFNINILYLSIYIVSFVWFLTGTLTIFDDNIKCIKKFNSDDILIIILWITHFFTLVHLVFTIKIN
jgi:hypothetical protein